MASLDMFGDGFIGHLLAQGVSIDPSYTYKCTDTRAGFDAGERVRLATTYSSETDRNTQMVEVRSLRRNHSRCMSVASFDARFVQVEDESNYPELLRENRTA